MKTKKRRFGPQLFLYPMPVVIVGAHVDGKPNFNAIAYCGVAQSIPPMLAISMDKRRHTHKGILQNNSFSINIPSRDMLEITDFIGTFSGKEVEKFDLFEVFYGAMRFAPMIEKCPINMSCELIHIMDFGGKNDLIVGKVVESYVGDEYMTEDCPDIEKMQPFVFTRCDQRYWSIGTCLGTAHTIGRKGNA